MTGRVNRIPKPVAQKLSGVLKGEAKLHMPTISCFIRSCRTHSTKKKKAGHHRQRDRIGRNQRSLGWGLCLCKSLKWAEEWLHWLNICWLMSGSSFWTRKIQNRKVFRLHPFISEKKNKNIKIHILITRWLTTLVCEQSWAGIKSYLHYRMLSLYTKQDMGLLPSHKLDSSGLDMGIKTSHFRNLMNLVIFHNQWSNKWVKMDNQQSGQRYVPLFHSNVYRFLNITILKRDEWSIIAESITNYEDKTFLNSLWRYGACHDWFSSVQNDDTMKHFSWEEATTLGEFIKKVKPFNNWILNLAIKHIPNDF